MVEFSTCLLYTSDAADDSLRVDLGGRRIIKKMYYIPAVLHHASTRELYLMIRRPPRSTRKESSEASDVYKRQVSCCRCW